MKYLIILLTLVGISIVFPMSAYASPGGLDKNGGHHCRKSKEYCAKYGLKLNQYHCHKSYCKPKK